MSFPRYEHYKESGVDWLGEVPEGWEIKRLKFLCNVQTGDKDTVNAIEDGEYPFFVRSQTIEHINSFTFDCEAVLTAGDGVGVGKVFHHYTGKFDFHQRVYMMNNFRFMSGKFFFCYLSSMFHKVALEGGTKSTVDSLRMPLFMNFEFFVPPLPEQQTISAFLDRETAKIDELVAEQERLIELLKEKRQVVISHAVTKGLNPAAPMKDSGIEWLGDVPEGCDDELSFLDKSHDDIKEDMYCATSAVLKILNAKYGGGSLFSAIMAEIYLKLKEYRVEIALETVRRRTKVNYEPATMNTIFTNCSVISLKSLP